MDVRTIEAGDHVGQVITADPYTTVGDSYSTAVELYSLQFYKTIILSVSASLNSLVIRVWGDYGDAYFNVLRSI